MLELPLDDQYPVTTVNLIFPHIVKVAESNSVSTLF